MNLHAKIMNLEIAREALTDSGGVHIEYRLGHRDARHAAAELAQERENQLEQQIEFWERLSNKRKDQVEELVAALEDAKSFIENGVELGYITMSISDTPDSAHNTLTHINAVLTSVKGDEE